MQSHLRAVRTFASHPFRTERENGWGAPRRCDTYDLERGWWPRFAPRGWALTWDQEYPLRAALRWALPIPRRPLGLDFYHSLFS